MKRTITGTALVVLCLVLRGQTASAQSTCKDAKGNIVESFDGVSTSAGTLTNAGWLDGTVVSVFNSAPFATPDPTQVTFASTFILTTTQGQLKGINRVYLLDLVRGQGVSWVKIDPAASTGIFAGATGALFINLIKSTNVLVGPYYEVVGGQICFAR
jgi:hypothetical protein